MPITNLAKQHAQVAVADETEFYDQSVAQARQEEQTILLKFKTACNTNGIH